MIEVNNWYLVGGVWSKSGFSLVPCHSSNKYLLFKDGKYMCKYSTLEDGFRSVEDKLSVSNKSQ